MNSARPITMLIAALGGGWDASQLPDAGTIKGANPAYP